MPCHNKNEQNKTRDATEKTKAGQTQHYKVGSIRPSHGIQRGRWVPAGWQSNRNSALFILLFVLWNYVFSKWLLTTGVALRRHNPTPRNSTKAGEVGMPRGVGCVGGLVLPTLPNTGAWTEPNLGTKENDEQDCRTEHIRLHQRVRTSILVLLYFFGGILGHLKKNSGRVFHQEKSRRKDGLSTTLVNQVLKPAGCTGSTMIVRHPLPPNSPLR